MRTLRKNADRGITKIGWLDSKHTFSFGDYYDPSNHHFRALRVINDDIIHGGGGFPTHPHRDMEIITYVLRGQLAHRDSMGNGSIIHAGEWQKMTAGRGITHSEYNASPTEEVHLLQMWIVPNQKGLTPSYHQQYVADVAKLGRWALAASSDGRDDSIPLAADADLYVATVRPIDQLSFEMRSGRGVWLHVATGSVIVDGQLLHAGDALRMEDEPGLTVRGHELAEVLLFDLA